MPVRLFSTYFTIIGSSCILVVVSEIIMDLVVVLIRILYFRYTNIQYLIVYHNTKRENEAGSRTIPTKQRIYPTYRRKSEATAAATKSG